jgi:predicted PurR-regulated permease PerM
MEKQLPEQPVVAPSPSPAAAEALKRTPEAVKRSMPMALSIALGILLAGLLGWFFQTLTWFILLLYLSFISATILEAPVQWLKRAKIRRGLAAVIVMVGGLGLLLGGLYLVTNSVYNQIVALSANLEKAPERINSFVNGLKERFPGLGNRLGDFDVGAALGGMNLNLSALWQNAMWGVEGISWLVIMFFIVLYMLVDGADHLKAVRCLLPKHSRLEATRLFTEMSKAHRGWALATLFNVTSSTLMTGVGLWLLGIPGAFLLGFVAGLGEIIPNIGPLMGAVPALIITLLAVPDMFWWVVLMFVVVQTVQSYTLSPMMLKFSVELPVLVTIISVLTFGTLFGFLGILVAIPLVADMVVIWQYVNRYLEKDTEDYDQVNTRAMGARVPASPDNTHPSRLRKLFRRERRRANPSEGATQEPPEATGLDRLDQVERKASNGTRKPPVEAAAAPGSAGPPKPGTDGSS